MALGNGRAGLSPDGVLFVLGCGSRDWTDCERIWAVFGEVFAQYRILTVVEGGAPGADHCVGTWAASHRVEGVHWVRVPARWDSYPPKMRWKAGFDRNQAMADMLLSARDGFGHGVVTFAWKDRLDDRLFSTRPELARGGTEDMIRRSWAAGIPTFHAGDSNELARITPN